MFRPIFVTDYRSALCHTVTYGERKSDFLQERFDFFVQSCTAYDYLIEPSSEGFHQGCEYFLFEDCVDDRGFQQHFHNGFVCERFQFGFVNLLYDERYGYYDVGLYS